MPNTIFGNNLKTLRKNLNITQADLARMINISTSAVGMYEQGRREPDIATLLAICSTLNTSVNYLFGMEDLKNIKNDLNDIIDDFTKLLRNRNDLTINGFPASSDSKEKIVSAIKLAAAIAMSKE